MDEVLRQAVVDFEDFLSGNKAPALVGYSLVTILKNDIHSISQIVIKWAINQVEGELVDNILLGRNKVFDIFFYRVVRFENIYKFFPSFESALIENCPAPQNIRLASLFKEFFWENIRPLGEFKQQPVFAIEKRPETKIEEEVFNENVYKNVTHNILSLENRYDFDDPQFSTQIAEHQAKVGNLFKNFISLVKDQQSRKEIFIANESDKDAVYETKKKFNLEDYIAQSLDLAIAFFNDDYLLQSVHMINLIVELCNAKSFKVENSLKFQSKCNLFSTHKIEQYSASRINRFLLRNIFNLFEEWHSGKLLDKLLIEESRKIRRILLSILECYGSNIYATLLADLMNSSDETPWYYVRNLIYLLGKIVTNDFAAKKQAIELIDRYLRPGSIRVLSLQCISTLSFINTEIASEKLITKLKIFQKYEDATSLEIVNKIAIALIGFETEIAVQTAFDHASKKWTSEYIDRFSQINIPNTVLFDVINKIRSEVKKMKFSFSLFGNVEMATSLLKSIGHMRLYEVLSLCKEIVSALPSYNILRTTANNILSQQIMPPVSILAQDKFLNRFALARNIAEMICYINEVRFSGKLSIETTESAQCEIDFDCGEILDTKIELPYVDQQNAFYWIFLLEPADILQVKFITKSNNEKIINKIQIPTSQLLFNGLLQKGELQQIGGMDILPDSRFSQRKVGTYFLQFKDSLDPNKCQLVWNALVDNPDIHTLQQSTTLSKYDLYKILFYFVKQNLIVVDGNKKISNTSNLDDGLTMLELYLQRIARKPVMFSYYKTSSDICSELSTESSDDVIKFAMDVLKKYYFEAYLSRRIFITTNLDICHQVIKQILSYVKSKSVNEKESLLSYINFTFQEKNASLMPSSIITQETTVLEKIENIESNDALDEDLDSLFDENMMDEMFNALDSIMATTGSQGHLGNQDINLTKSEESMLLDLYDNIATAYVKPFKDFVREIQLNKKINRQTSTEWIEMVDPSINLLLGSAEKMGYDSICKVLNEIQKVLNEYKLSYDQTCLNPNSVEIILNHYEQLAQMLPKTFALDLSTDDLNSKKEVLIVKFILKQLPEINEKMLNRIILAGLSTFDKFMHSSPDEIAAVTGLGRKQSEDIFMKFYQYRHMYYRHNDDAYKGKFLEMFEVKLNILREIHLELESIVETDSGEVLAKKNELKMDRQRTLWAIFILLCIKEEYDLIESVQQSVFDMRIKRLEDYLYKLAAA